MRRLGRFCLWFLLGVLLLVTAGTLVPRPLFQAAVADEPKLHRILVLSNPIHTDIALPLDPRVEATFAFLRQDNLPIDDPAARYAVFGWGGRSFYIETPTWSELKALPLLKGLTADSAAMHVEVSGEIDARHPSVAAYDISEKQFISLLAYIRASFRDENGAPIVIPGAGYGEFDQFYEAHGTFTALLGCNTWTAAALRIAGLRTGWWTPLPKLLGYSMDIHNPAPVRP